ncbi:MAG: hypothetical protein KDD47_27330, partial [Acidobacteria bacterium]|nr:hypothetical protein [Acidobacteriota bacterium]
MREAHSRSAHASIAGYLYQAYLGLERWLALGDKEVIVFEGDEDIDRLLLGTASGVSEQVKLRSGDLGAGVVRKCLRSFLPTYIALQKKEADRRYRFVSNADLLPGSPLRGLISALQAWSHLGEERQREVVLEWKAWLQPADGEGDAALLNAYRWLDQEEGRWGAWLSSLEFVLESPAIPAIRGSLLDALRRRED